MRCWSFLEKLREAASKIKTTKSNNKIAGAILDLSIITKLVVYLRYVNKGLDSH